MKAMKGMKPRPNRAALTQLFTALVLCFMIVPLLFTGVTIYLLLHFNILTGPGHTTMMPKTVILIFIPSAVLLGLLMTALLARIPLKPVNKLINQINRLAAGDYRARLDYGDFEKKYPVLSELTGSFNRMAEELQNTELLRSDFINNFSHEFKTTIVSIAGFAKLLRRSDLTEAEREEYLHIIETESLRLAQMATNVLYLTKVENQTILTDLTTYNLSEQIRSCILLLSEKWEKKELELVLDFDEYTILASEEPMQQVWINLLSNAVKFCPPGGTIDVRITQSADSTCVCVRNTGSEIAPAQQKKIFNKFYQADESHASEGSGIGLAIVKRIVTLHEGEVSVQSGNNATAFTVTLPRRS